MSRKMENRLKKLRRLTAKALGLYMSRRIIGESGDVQRRRLERLTELIKSSEIN